MLFRLEISEQEEVIRKLSADKELRAEIRSELRKLDTPDAYTIASLFSISHPVYSRRFYRLLTILQFAPFVLLGIVYITSSLYVLGISGKHPGSVSQVFVVACNL